ncbi:MULTISPECIES: hypothetical protein [Nocardia]|uniref:hypothetical protein n=1 Tax=Nocardia TaxID=1817 RepID=UPI002458EC7D|nr:MULTISPECIES: hypothetical protein [Nocardia]
MRGPSAWSVADRELMAAFVSKVNGCTFCSARLPHAPKVAYPTSMSSPRREPRGRQATLDRG